MTIDYAEANRLCRLHKGRLTRATKKGPEAVLVAVDAFYEAFDAAHLPLPDDWARWDRAASDARFELARKDW